MAKPNKLVVQQEPQELPQGESRERIMRMSQLHNSRVVPARREFSSREMMKTSLQEIRDKQVQLVKEVSGHVVPTPVSNRQHHSRRCGR